MFQLVNNPIKCIKQSKGDRKYNSRKLINDQGISLYCGTYLARAHQECFYVLEIISFLWWWAVVWGMRESIDPVGERSNHCDWFWNLDLFDWLVVIVIIFFWIEFTFVDLEFVFWGFILEKNRLKRSRIREKMKLMFDLELIKKEREDDK